MADDQLRGLRWAYVLMGVADGTLLPFIALYLLDRGLGPAGIGLVLAASALASLGGGLAWAYLADRSLSPELLVVLAAIAAPACALLLVAPLSAGMVGVAIVALSVARSPLSLLDPITLRRLRLTSRTDYARIRLRTSAGWAVAVLIAGAAFQSIGLRFIPLVYAPLSLLLAFWVWRRVKPLPAMSAAPAVELRPALAVGRIPLAMVGFLVGCLLLGISLAATQNFLALQINGLGGGAFLVGAAAAFQAATEIPTMGYTHVLTKYFSHRVLFAIGCAIYLVMFVAWAFAGSAVVAALLKLVVGVAFALTFVAAVMIANDLTPARLRATGQALVKSVLFGAAPIVGASGGGVVYAAFGPRAMFLASTVVVAAAGLAVLLAVPRHKHEHAEEPVLAPNPAIP